MTQTAEALCQPVLDNLSTAVLVLDNELRLRYLNAAAETLFSTSGQQSLGQPLGTLVRLDAALAAALDSVMSSASPVRQREVYLTRADGEAIQVDYHATPLFEGHEASGLTIELHRVDWQLRIAREEALIAQQDASRSLVRGLAHEIKNPLGGLRGAAQLLEHELPDAGLREYTAIIIRESDRLQGLVDRMLGPSQRPQLESINVHEITEHVLGLIKAEAGTGIEVVSDYDPSIPPLLADRNWAIQALLNVARNSLQALEGRGRLAIVTRVLRKHTIGTRVHRLVARVSVCDDGPGIDPAMQEKIFYPLVTGRPEGTGLGLSIAQSLVSQLGGLIECTSEPGKTVFDLLLPLEP